MPLPKRIVFNTLVDEKGNPIAGETVRVYLVRHAFAGEEATEIIRYGVEVQTNESGYWEMELIPNDVLEGETYYIVEEGRPTSPVYHQHFIRLPAGTTPIALKDIRITPPYHLAGLSPEQLVSAIVVDEDALKGQVKLVAGDGISITTVPTQKKITISQKAKTIWQKIAVAINNTVYGVRSTLNLIAGSNITLSPVDDAENDAIHVTISSTGGGGGGSTQHNLLDGSIHPDTSTTAVQRGMLIVGQLISGVVKWAGLVLGAAGKVLKSNGTDVVWGNVEWNEITNKPATFPPSSHTHPLSEISQSGAQTNQVPKWSGSSWAPGNVDWNEVTNKPTTFPPSAHSHAPADISPQGHTSGLNADMLDGQHATAFAAAVHTHVKADITDFAHTHAPTDISPQGHGSGLNADMVDGDHASAFERIANKGVPGGYASLDNNGKVVQDPANATATPTPNKIPIAGSDGKLATGWLSDNLRTVSVGITVGDGVNPITTGVKGAIWIPISGTITEWTILSTDGATPTTGSIEFDILKSTYADYPTMTSIVGSGTKPNISNSNKGNGAPTGWSTTQINAGDCLRFDVTSVTGLKRVTLVLKVVKS